MRKLLFAALVAVSLASCARSLTVVTGTRDGSPCAYEMWERAPLSRWCIVARIDACPERDSADLWHADIEN